MTKTMNIDYIEKMASWWMENEPEGTTTGGFHLLSLGLKSEWYLSWNSNRCRDIALRSKTTSRAVPDKLSSKYIKCYEKQTADKSFYLHFELIDHSFVDEFYVLCSHLISVAEAYHANEPTMVAKVMERFLLWKKMLREHSKSVEEYQGLFGELYTIKLLLKKGYQPESILNAWTGPDQTEQDFVFQNEWIEVKTVNTNAMTFMVNSLGQLDRDDVKGTLLVYRVIKETMKSPGNASVRELVREIRAKILEVDPTLSVAFDEKLVAFSYFIMESNDVYWFRIANENGINAFSVADSFPKLKRGYGRPEIKSVKYSLTIAALEDWRIKEWV